MSADLQRDLKLASATQDIRINPDEVTPKAEQALSVRPRRAPEGPRVVRTQNPTVRASATPVETAEIQTEIPEVQVASAAPAQSESPAPDAPPMARPAPMPMPTASSGATTAAGGGNAGGGTAGGILGGIFGAVIRGGVVGDDDHCDPRSVPRRNGGRPVGGDVVYGGMGNIGMGGARVPIRPMGRPR